MEIITPLQLYWVLRLDAIWGLCLATALSTGLIYVVMSFFYFVELDDYFYGNEDRVQKYKKVWHRFGIAFIVSVFLAVFMPDTRGAGAIYAVPNVINNPKVQELCGNSLDVFGMGVKRIKERMMINAETGNRQEKQ